MYFVFVSSTYTDLVDHRDAVQKAIKQLGSSTYRWRASGACDERPKKECLRIIANECDSFVGIYAHRYGFCPGRVQPSPSLKRNTTLLATCRDSSTW